MCRLAKNQELVEGIYTETCYQVQTDRQSNAAEEVHRFLERETPRVPQGPVRPPELVFDNIASIPQEHTPGFFLALDHMPDDADEMVEQLFLRSSERGLVRHLEEVADDFASLAVQPAVRESHLLQTREDLADLLGEHEAGEMDEHRRSQPRARVGGTRGEVPELRVVRIRNAR